MKSLSAKAVGRRRQPRPDQGRGAVLGWLGILAGAAVFVAALAGPVDRGPLLALTVAVLDPRILGL